MNSLSIKDFFTRTFKDIDRIFTEYYSNPILWIVIIAIALCIVAMMFNVLGNKR